jgi:hypothetical protein
MSDNLEYQKDGDTVTVKSLTNMRPSRFCELFFALKAKGDQLRRTSTAPSA